MSDSRNSQQEQTTNESLLHQVEALTAENERLKQEIKRLRSALQAQSGGGMSTRLKDALRE